MAQSFAVPAAVAITLTNEGDTEVALQADLYSWAQKPDGTDDLVLTEDLVVAPPIIKLAPRARQVVRLARLTPHTSSIGRSSAPSSHSRSIRARGRVLAGLIPSRSISRAPARIPRMA